MSMLEEMVQKLSGMPEKARTQLLETAMEATKHLQFIPQEGPQTMAYFSEADVLLFGGSPGGGKTALEIGLCLNAHHRCLVVRKEFVDLGGVLHTLDNIVGKPSSAVGGNRPVYRKPNGGVIEFVGMGDDIDSKQGNPHDLICVDEGAQLPEKQVRMLMGWLRTDRPGQRCRMVIASNPPLNEVGDWLIDYFAPWLDPRHPNPAQEGELRFFLPIPGSEGFRECKADDYIVMHGVKVKAQSRTFISSKFTDNKYYDAEDYAKALAGLPAEVRDKLISGNFMLARSDDIWQTIPTAWIMEAQERWTPQPPVGVPMCAIGVDVAQGGADNSTFAPRHDGWFDKIIKIPGEQTPGGAEVAGKVISIRRDGAAVIVDVGGGWGGEAVAHLERNGVETMSYLGVKTSVARTQDNQLGFRNVRSQAIWQLREALDPSQPGGSRIALPPSKTLLTDLAATRYKVGGQGIEVTSKEEVVKKLMRSPDEGDAVVMAWHSGPKMASHYNAWRSNNRLPTRAVMHRR